MADLKEILNKSKNKVRTNIRSEREPLNISTTARPYEDSFTNNKAEANKNHEEQGQKPNKSSQALQRNTNKCTKESITVLKDSLANKGDVSIKSVFNSIKGNERRLVYFLCNNVQENMATETEPLTKRQIALLTNIPHGSVSTTIKRLERKKILKRKNIIRGGWNAKYIFTIKKEFLMTEERCIIDENLTSM